MLDCSREGDCSVGLSISINYPQIQGEFVPLPLLICLMQEMQEDIGRWKTLSNSLSLGIGGRLCPMLLVCGEVFLLFVRDGKGFKSIQP
jgi:hypothetical protein